MLHEALRLIRIFHDINQTDLAKKLEISKSLLSGIESGKKTISLELLNKYSKIFNVTVSSLMLFSEEIENNNFSGKTKIFVADKILKIMSWLSDKNEKNVSSI